MDATEPTAPCSQTVGLHTEEGRRSAPADKTRDAPGMRSGVEHAAKILCGRPTRSRKPCGWSAEECPCHQGFEAKRMAMEDRWSRRSHMLLAAGPCGVRRAETTLRALESFAALLPTVADGYTEPRYLQVLCRPCSCFNWDAAIELGLADEDDVVLCCACDDRYGCLDCHPRMCVAAPKHQLAMTCRSLAAQVEPHMGWYSSSDWRRRIRIR